MKNNEFVSVLRRKRKRTRDTR